MAQIRDEREPVRPVRVVAVDVQVTEHAVFARGVLEDAAGQRFVGRLGSTFLFDFDAGDVLDEGFVRVSLGGGAA